MTLEWSETVNHVKISETAFSAKKSVISKIDVIWFERIWEDLRGFHLISVHFMWVSSRPNREWSRIGFWEVYKCGRGEELATLGG